MAGNDTVRAGAMSLFLVLTEASAAAGLCVADTAIPQTWGPVRGYAIAGDATALAAGDMRVYLLCPAKPVADGDLAQALNAPLQALQALQSLTVEGDITAVAAAHGVTAPQFLPAARSSEKRQQPNRIYRYSAAGHSGYFIAFVAIDQPEAALAGSLHCLLETPKGVQDYAQITLGGIAPHSLPRIVAAACQNALALRAQCPSATAP
jgi:hypothetical protein